MRSANFTYLLPNPDVTISTSGNNDQWPVPPVEGRHKSLVAECGPSKSEGVGRAGPTTRRRFANCAPIASVRSTDRQPPQQQQQTAKCELKTSKEAAAAMCGNASPGGSCGPFPSQPHFTTLLPPQNCFAVAPRGANSPWPPSMAIAPSLASPFPTHHALNQNCCCGQCVAGGNGGSEEKRVK